METVYDWVTVAIFAGLIVLFLQRSQGEPRDHLWQYLIASVGCAVSNYLGNEGHHAFAVLSIGATLAFIVFVLRPFDGFRS